MLVFPSKKSWAILKVKLVLKSKLLIQFFVTLLLVLSTITSSLVHYNLFFDLFISDAPIEDEGGFKTVIFIVIVEQFKENS